MAVAVVVVVVVAGVVVVVVVVVVGGIGVAAAAAVAVAVAAAAVVDFSIYSAAATGSLFGLALGRPDAKRRTSEYIITNQNFNPSNRA